MSLHLSTGTLLLSMKNSVSMPSACPGIPCTSLPSSFEYAVSYNLQYFGFFITCQNSISSPVSSFKNALIILIGDFRPESFLGDIFTCNVSAYSNMAYCVTVQVWILVLCAGPSSFNVSASSCLTSSASLTDCWGGSTLGGVQILFAGTTLDGNLRLGFTLGGGEGFYEPVGPLGGVKGVTGGRKNNGGVCNIYGAGSPHSYLSALLSFRMLPSVVSCSSVVSLRCSRGFPFSSCDILAIASMDRSSGVTTNYGKQDTQTIEIQRAYQTTDDGQTSPP